MTAATQARIRSLQIWNPIDHARLLWWVFFTPDELTRYRARLGPDSTRGIGTWLASTLLWLPLLIPIVAVALRTIPVQDDLVPLWIIIAGIVLGWAVTAWAGGLEYPPAEGWKSAFGPVFEGAFLIVFGVAFGIAFGMALISGLDMMEIISVSAVFGQQGLFVMVAAFGAAFGISYIIADKVAFGGAFIIAPMVAMCITGFITFGLGFVGAFVAIFLTTFGIAFVGSFIAAFLIASLLVKRLERRPDSLLARGLRVGGLGLLIAAHTALVWVCLLGGWRLLVGL
jgi:hypothetical protein